MGWQLGQDDEPVDRDALGDRPIPRRSRRAAGIVVAIPRNIDHAPVRFVGTLGVCLMMARASAYDRKLTYLG